MMLGVVLMQHQTCSLDYIKAKRGGGFSWDCETVNFCVHILLPLTSVAKPTSKGPSNLAIGLGFNSMKCTLLLIDGY